MDFLDLTGQRFGRLVVISRFPRKGRVSWSCLCDCGNTPVVTRGELRDGKTKSCGCYRKEKLKRDLTTHGDSGGGKGTPTKMYKVWASMLQRCTNAKSNHYKDYGGRGISVCERWNKYSNFKEDMGDSYKYGLTLDRINNDDGYFPNNCRWVSQKQQKRNTRKTIMVTYKDETKPLSEWVEILGLPYDRTHHRITHGYTPEDAFKLENFDNKSRKRKNENTQL